MTMLSVVIPAYNEEDGLRAVLEQVLDVQPALASVGLSDVEVIVVDDGSTDGTAEQVTGLTGVRLIRHRHNAGYGAALKTGFAAARGEWIAFLDADGTYPAAELPALCRIAVAGTADLVIGSRMAGRESQMPLVRRIGNLLFARLVSLASAQPVSDSASGMRVFRRSILERILPLPDGLNLTPVMSIRALHEGLHVVEVPITYRERTGRSKLNVMRDGMRFAQSVVWTALTYNPVRQLGFLGLACLSVTLAVGCALFVQRLRGTTSLGPLGVFALYVAATLAVAGVSVFSLGAMFNYLVALARKRPVRQGLLGRPLFQPPLDRHFWWLGLLAMIGGLGIAIASLILGLRGWEIRRLWFWQLLAAMGGLTGLQLVISWLIMRVLEELSLAGEVEPGADDGRHAPPRDTDR